MTILQHLLCSGEAQKGWTPMTTFMKMKFFKETKILFHITACMSWDYAVGLSLIIFHLITTSVT